MLLYLKVHAGDLLEPWLKSFKDIYHVSDKKQQLLFSYASLKMVLANISTDFIFMQPIKCH